MLATQQFALLTQCSVATHYLGNADSIQQIMFVILFF